LTAHIATDRRLAVEGAAAVLREIAAAAENSRTRSSSSPSPTPAFAAAAAREAGTYQADHLRLTPLEGLQLSYRFVQQAQRRQRRREQTEHEGGAAAGRGRGLELHNEEQDEARSGGSSDDGCGAGSGMVLWERLAVRLWASAAQRKLQLLL
jgi:hypothetical protein